MQSLSNIKRGILGKSIDMSGSHATQSTAMYSFRHQSNE